MENTPMKVGSRDHAEQAGSGSMAHSSLLMAACCGLPVLVVVVLVAGVGAAGASAAWAGALQGAAPFMLLLACPLMMGGMLLAMRFRGRKKGREGDECH